MAKIKLSVLIVAKNEESVIADCLESVAGWAEEIVFLDTGSTDKTVSIAKKYPVGLFQIKSEKLEYARWRNFLLAKASGDWVLYLDADERVTPELKEEIQSKISNSGEARPRSAGQLTISAYALPRRNFLLGKEFHFFGWWPGPDYVKRLFKKNKLKGWKGGLHEEPVFSSRGGSASGGEGSLGKLENPLIHLQPETIEPALEKSIRWSKLEAKLLYEAGHPPVVWWRILRMGATTLFDRLIKRQGFRDGTEGWIESIYQAFHTMIVYMQLWEFQRQRN